MKRIVRLTILVFGIAFCVWVYFAPHLTVRTMRLAAERGDAEALAAHVDFPALRNSVKTQLADTVNDRISERVGTGMLRDLGTGLAGAMAGPMIDATISPQALTLLFAGRGLARDGLAAATASNTSGERVGRGTDLRQWKAAMAYENLGTFAVTLQPADDSAAPAKLIFKRHHVLWWKLSGIEIPTQ
jgi:hypothetical protein